MMILIDTNVFSEIVRPQPDDNVVDWFFAHRNETLLSTLVIAELRVGIGTTPGRGKRELLRAWLDRLITNHQGRIVEFDQAAALRWGEMASAMIIGDGRANYVDSLLAAQALSRDIPVATRNIRDFEDTGETTINPWDD